MPADLTNLKYQFGWAVTVYAMKQGIDYRKKKRTWESQAHEPAEVLHALRVLLRGSRENFTESLFEIVHILFVKKSFSFLFFD